MTSTPTIPSTIDPQRQGPTVSFSTTTDRSVMTSGDTKAIAVPSAKGRLASPMKNSPLPSTTSSPRQACIHGRPIRRFTRPPDSGKATPRMKRQAPTARRSVT